MPRPPTPTVFRPGDKVEEEELAVIMLQKIIRGRALQTKVQVEGEWFGRVEWIETGSG